MQATVILQLLGVLKSLATLLALIVSLLRVDLSVGVHETRIDGRLKAAQLAGVQLHVDLVGPPEMRMQTVPIAKVAGLAFRAHNGLV